MGKANKIKSDLEDITELVEIIQVLKDVADTKFHELATRKDRFARFGESFVEFFRMISLSTVRHPLVSNDNPNIGILGVTSEAGFMGDLNAKTIRAIVAEKERYPQGVLIIVGRKGAEKLAKVQPNMKTFVNLEEVGLYEIAIRIKDYLVQEVMEDRLGKIVVVYPWSKTFNLQKPRTVKLLPCDELLIKQAEFVDAIESVILESDAADIIGYLADMWLVCRIYEILHDSSISEAAAQSQQLEASVQKMKKDKKGIAAAFTKARKGDIDKGMREIFTARMMTKR
ncbi:MAG TPA: F0F1 ATP synthase subunit gamma [Candidatus Omnitrophota bacterium]|jgi:ATP synthase F1 gamma subunit|nr:F0F1 ATP synthase subunit gamma [Candidatus Omnitrophota bacterium]HPN55844.1 F0F1 ATP synthase subunit gamma [Candidatus Omnitrophota bacterium]